MRILIATLAFFLSAVASSAATYNMFDHPAGANNPPYDYGLRLDGLPGSGASGYWSFESLVGASLATLSVNIPGGTASITGSLRHNLDNSLWTLNISMTGVTSLAGIGAGAGSFGAAGYTGTLTSGGTTHNLVGKGKNVHGTVYQWTMFFQDPGGVDWRAPNISAGWVGSVDGGTSMLSGTNDFIATVAPVPVPAAGLLLLSAFGGLTVLRRRQRSA